MADGCGHGQQALRDAGEHASRVRPAVVFEIQLALNVWLTDSIHWRPAEVAAAVGLVPLVWSEQVRPDGFGDLTEPLASEALFGQRQLAVVEERVVVLQQRGHRPFAELGVGQAPHDRLPSPASGPSRSGSGRRSSRSWRVRPAPGFDPALATSRSVPGWRRSSRCHRTRTGAARPAPEWSCSAMAGQHSTWLCPASSRAQVR